MSFSLWSRFSAVVVAFVVAVGVVFGAAQITSGSTNSTKETVFVGIVPTRLLDTRENTTTFDGFDQAVGRLDAGTTYELDIAGRAGIPIDAASVTANFVAVNPSGTGYLTVYPCSVDRPLASAVNYMPGVNNANEFSVPLGPDGDICIYTHAETDIVVDIYGYYIAGSGADGQDGTDGQDGADGADGADGVDGQDAESPARVIWVADDDTGDFLKLSTALASIPDGNTKPYVIKIAPGTYTELTNVAMKDFVDVEGSGQGITTIECACSSNSSDALAAVISAGAIAAEIRHLTINNTGGSNDVSFGVYTTGVVNGSFSMLHVTATATGTGTKYGVANFSSSSPTMTNVTATATGSTNNYGVANFSSSSPTMTNVTATATGANGNYGVYNYESSPTMTNVTATATGNNTNFGVYNLSSSSPTMNNVTATATGGTSSTGVYNNSSSPTIRNSSITGNTNSILNSGSTAKVADTALGGDVAGGLFTCVGAYTTTFSALDGDCGVF